MANKVKIRGLARTIRGMARAETDNLDALDEAEAAEAAEIGRVAVTRAPEITGDLRRSERERSVGTRRRPKHVIEFTMPYAFTVHETPRPPGSNGQWQYLASALKDAESGYTGRIAERMKKITGQR